MFDLPSDEVSKIFLMHVVDDLMILCIAGLYSWGVESSRTFTDQSPLDSMISPSVVF